MADRFDFRTESLLRARASSGMIQVSLSEALARLSRGEDLEFSAVQAHQQHAVHAFFVQLAALCVEDPKAPLPTDTAAWEKLLLELSGGEPSAWFLVVEDLARPALFQPPIPEGTIAALEEVESLQQLDVLIVVKSHDIKVNRLRNVSADLAFMQLLSMQTMDGYGGPKNYGIARLASGASSRISAGVAIDDRLGSRFLPDVQGLRAARRPKEVGWSDRGARLLWTLPWDGTTSLDLSDCHPFCIEICRRVRIRIGIDGLSAFTKGTVARRIAAEQAHGDLGDYWLPYSVTKGEALAFLDASYRTIHEVLLSPTSRTPSLEDISASGDMKFVLRLLARGRKGKTVTDGYFEKIIPIAGKVRARLALDGGRAQIGALSQRRLDQADTAETKVLKPALLVALQGAPKKLNFKDDRVGPWLERLDALIDGAFFEHLFADADLDDDVADARFAKFLSASVRAVFKETLSALPVPDGRRFRAYARAEIKLERCIRRHLTPETATASAAGDPS